MGWGGVEKMWVRRGKDDVGVWMGGGGSGRVGVGVSRPFPPD